MTCERFLELLDGLDNEKPPAAMAAHVRSCPACARRAAALQSAVDLYRLPDIAGSSNMVPRVAAMLPFVSAPRRSVSMRNWLGAGFVLLVSMIMIPGLSAFMVIAPDLGADFMVPVSLVLGCLVTAYSGLFVVSHLDDFSRRLKAYQGRQAHKAA
ncbi:MAG: hypothetical protein CVV51_10515 [Spirochaetae bacterium HGW-Spirochaetae-7]|jgi:predicted anti-sigma-YlaC factor YlaD|nr:MAG: hypothetical protein CVV51_10515 [Spirochaetae bacterium HGW-Spirochaetae-7]